MKKQIKMSKVLGLVFTILFIIFILGECFHINVNIYVVLIFSVLGTFSVRKKLSIVDKQILVMIGYLFIYALSTILINNGGMGSAFTLISGLFVFFAFKNITITELQRKMITYALIFNNLFWVFQSKGYYEIAFRNHWLGDGSMVNSNGVGKYICYTAILIFIFMNKKRWERNFAKFILVISFVGIYNCRARISLVILTVFLILSFVFSHFEKLNNKKMYMGCYYGIWCTVISFPILYVQMYKQGIGMNIQTFGLSSKSLYSGREIIWNNVFEGMKSVWDWMFGVGSQVDYWKGHVLNVHNNAMNLIVVFGICGLIIYIYLLSYILKKEFVFIKSEKVSNQLILFFFCILLEGISDITIFYNGLLLYYFAPLGMACNLNNRKLKECGEKNI